MNKCWREQALELHAEGMSWRKIAKAIGKPKSTVSDYLRKELKPLNIPKNTTPRILVLDIETSSIVLNAWRLFNVNASLDQIEEDWNILSWSAKWLGEKEVTYRDIRNGNPRDDTPILQELWDLVNEAHFIIAHNGRKFDMRKINARFVLNGYPKPSPYRIIDTLEIARREFGFTSNKLEYLADKLNVKYKKLNHSEFAGYSLWKECMLGNMRAWEVMEEYNIHDVLALEEVYLTLSKWDSKLPVFDVYEEEIDLSDWVHVDYFYTNLSKFKLYRNKVTGQFRRGRTNLLTKDQRSNILANVIV